MRPSPCQGTPSRRTTHFPQRWARARAMAFERRVKPPREDLRRTEHLGGHLSVVNVGFVEFDVFRIFEPPNSFLNASPETFPPSVEGFPLQESFGLTDICIKALDFTTLGAHPCSINFELHVGFHE